MTRVEEQGQGAASFALPRPHGPPRGALKSDWVAADLEELIVRGDIAPAQPLPTEAALRDVYGVSMSVIRDAMRTLVARGLVSVRQGRGTVVATPTEASFEHAFATLLARTPLTTRDVFAARGAVETQLAPLAARNATADDVARLGELLVAFAAAVARDDHPAAEAAHAGFHLAIIRCFHLPALELFLLPLHQVILATAGNPSAVLGDLRVDLHEAIGAAIATRDADAAQQAMASHFDHYMAAFPGYGREPFREALVAARAAGG